MRIPSWEHRADEEAIETIGTGVAFVTSYRGWEHRADEEAIETVTSYRGQIMFFMLLGTPSR